MRKNVIWWIVAALWCVMIFYMSSKPADISSQDSGFIADILNNLAGNNLPHEGVLGIENIVRKTAHFLEYSVLGFLLFMALYSGLKPFRPFKWLLLKPLIPGVVYAISDELHQIFVPGRAGRILDVSIDSAGIIFGIYLAYLLSKKLVSKT